MTRHLNKGDRFVVVAPTESNVIDSLVLRTGVVLSSYLGRSTDKTIYRGAIDGYEYQTRMSYHLFHPEEIEPLE